MNQYPNVNMQEGDNAIFWQWTNICRNKLTPATRLLLVVAVVICKNMFTNFTCKKNQFRGKWADIWQNYCWRGFMLSLFTTKLIIFSKNTFFVHEIWEMHQSLS